MNIAVFASHEGSDLQAIIDAYKKNLINSNVSVVISNNEDSMALKRANRENIPSYYLSVKKCGGEENLARSIITILDSYDIDVIFLLGYMKLLHNSIIEKYDNKIFNIHPSLLPKFGGKGMYGMSVHKAVIDSKESETGITIHRVNSKYDSGEIVSQTKVKVNLDDTAEALAHRVLEREHVFLIETISKIESGKILLNDKKVLTLKK